MKRREFLQIAAVTATPSGYYRDYSRCLPDYLRSLAQDAYERRNRALAKLTSKEPIAARQHWVRETLWKLIGGEPERTPLNARTTGLLERDGYRLEKLIYESRPRLFVTANLYVPAGAGPFPGVLFQMGHSRNGKAYEPYQKCCQSLARLGYVVLAFDPMGQGERAYYPRLESPDDEHTKPGKQMLLLGDTSTRFQLWDAVRSLDYLAGHPLVDPKRLASTGQSGGGTLTMLLAAVDDRLRTAVVASGNTENMACADFNPPGATDDAEQDFLGSGPLGFDRWDLLYPIAPKPLLVMVSEHDFFGTYSPRYISNGREEFQKLARVYAALGHKDRIEWADSPLPHGLGYEPRMRIYQWFEKWLKGSGRNISGEPTTAPEPDAALWAGPTGNAVRDFASRAPFDLVQERAASIRTPDKLEGIEPLLGIARPPRGLPAKVLRRVPSGAVDVEAIEVASADRVRVPVWRYASRKAGPTLLLLEERGRGAHWGEGDLYERLAAAGFTVCAADVRGIGDLRPEVGRGAPGYTLPHDTEEEFAWASLILGKPLLGQRVTDILALVEALKDGRGVVLAANGKLTVPALFAAALTRDVAHVYLAGGLASLRSVVETEDSHEPLSNLAFNLLAHTDLPQLAAAVAPRRVTMGREAAWNFETLSAL